VEKQASLLAFLNQPCAPRLTALQVCFRGNQKGVSLARVLAALPRLHRVISLTVTVEWDALRGIPYAVSPTFHHVLRGIVRACWALQQLQIQVSTICVPVDLNPDLWRALFRGRGRCCLPRSSLRRLELAAAPGPMCLGRSWLSKDQFPSLAWLPELMLRSHTFKVDSLASPTIKPGPDPDSRPDQASSGTEACSGL
jgi:hypothetical protein